MNNQKTIFAISLIAVSLAFGSCSTAPDMDEVIKDTEINAPAPSNGDGNGDGTGTSGSDNPIGG